MNKSIFLVFVIIILIGSSWEEESFVNEFDSSIENLNDTNNSEDDFLRATNSDDYENTVLDDEERSRIRRNILLSSNNLNLNGQSNVEGLLSSCQLTNLLLYQLINQKFSIPGGGPGGNPLQQQLQPQSPFLQPIYGFGDGGIINPNSFNAPILQTYLSTSTILNEETSTSTHTVTLNFGNKESTAIITNTKKFNVTSSQIFTLTSTIQPTQSSLLDDSNERTTSTLPSFNREADYNDEYDKSNYEKDNTHHPHTNFKSTPVLDDHEIENKPSKISFNRQKYRKQSSNVERNSEISSGLSGRKYNRQENRFSIKKHDGNVQEDNNNYYQKDNNNNNGQQNFYIRRPKRRGDEIDTYESLPSDVDYENSELPLERDHLLEPSHDDGGIIDGEGGYDENDNINHKCPKPIEITITKTVTKFVNPPSSIKFNTGDFNIHDITSSSTNNPNKNIIHVPVPENFNNNKERRIFRPTTSKTTGEEEEDNLDTINDDGGTNLQSRTQIKKFKNTGTVTTTERNTRTSTRLEHLRASLGNGAGGVLVAKNQQQQQQSPPPIINIETPRTSNKFIRNRGGSIHTGSTTLTTTTPKQEINNGGEQFRSNRRSSSRYRSSTTTQSPNINNAGNIFSYDNNSGSRFRGKSTAKHSEYYESTPTTMPRFKNNKNSRFNNKNNENPNLSTTIGVDIQTERNNENIEKKYNRLKSRFNPTSV